jgi:septum formation protein
MGVDVLLASSSSGRLAMLEAAGVYVRAVPPYVDEVAIKQAMMAQGAKARDIADSLAEAKALKISRKVPDALVIGSDQMLETADGHLLDKPETITQAIAHLAMLSGTTHRLMSAVVICEGGRPVWRHIDVVKMTMRVLSPPFIDRYVATYWDHIRHVVGCYRIEAEGAQLFAKVEGSQFSVIGIPLLPVLDYLRVRQVLAS